MIGTTRLEKGKQIEQIIQEELKDWDAIKPRGQVRYRFKRQIIPKDKVPVSLVPLLDEMADAWKPAPKPFKKSKRLTFKQNSFVKERLKDPKATLATIVQRSEYDPKDDASAQVVGSSLMAKPKIQSELAKYNNLVETTLIDAVSDYSHSDDIKERTLAVNTSQYLHDKIHGKATQRTENVNINIEQALQELV